MSRLLTTVRRPVAACRPSVPAPRPAPRLPRAPAVPRQSSRAYAKGEKGSGGGENDKNDVDFVAEVAKQPWCVPLNDTSRTPNGLMHSLTVKEPDASISMSDLYLLYRTEAESHEVRDPRSNVPPFSPDEFAEVVSRIDSFIAREGAPFPEIVRSPSTEDVLMHRALVPEAALKLAMIKAATEAAASEATTEATVADVLAEVLRMVRSNDRKTGILINRVDKILSVTKELRNALVGHLVQQIEDFHALSTVQRENKGE